MSDEFVTVKIVGLEELEKKLHELDDEVQTKVVRNAVRAGANVFKEEIVLRTPKNTGLTAQHIDVKTRKQKSVADAVSALIGPNNKLVIHKQDKGKTAGMKRTAAKIMSFLEFGTSKEGKHPVMTQAFESTKGRVIDKVIEKIKQGLSKWGL